jgi:hypothetical protein
VVSDENARSVTDLLADRTARLLTGSRVWQILTPVLKPYRRTITAAIACVTAETFVLDSGSTVIVDASEATVRAGATDPSVLLKWVRTGVQVHSLTRLNTKLILAESPSRELPAFMLTGSSTIFDTPARRLREAVMVADTEECLTEARQALVEWKQEAGTALTVTQLEELATVFGADRVEPEVPEEVAAEEPVETFPVAEAPTVETPTQYVPVREDVDSHVTPPTPAPAAPAEPQPDFDWPKPTALSLFRSTDAVNVTAEAEKQLQQLAQRLGVATRDTGQQSFVLDLAYVEHVHDPAKGPARSYPLNSHVVQVRETPGGKLLRTCPATEPARIELTFDDHWASPPRTYYYLLRKTSRGSKIYGDVRLALEKQGEKLNLAATYRRARIIDALLELWPDVTYS